VVLDNFFYFKKLIFQDLKLLWCEFWEGVYEIMLALLGFSYMDQVVRTY
jgi:hypothetical protein